MIDRGAFALVPGDITGLFRRLNGAPMYDILDTLDALLREKNFYPNFNTYRSQLDSAGIFVARMEVAMSAVLAKNAKQTSWDQFKSIQANKLSQLPPDQQGNIKDYFTDGATPNGSAGVGAAAGKTSAAQLVWMGVRLKELPTDVIEAFAAGLVIGAARQVSQDKTWATKLQTTITGDPLGFQWGYSLGVLTGLVEGLKNLLDTVVDLAKLSISIAPVAVAIVNPALALGWIASQGLLLLTDQSERQLRQRQLEEAKAIAETVSFAITDIGRNPDSYVDLSQQVGVQLGRTAGDWFTQDFVNLSAKELGQRIGAIIGLVLFEILLEILLAMATGGTGNAAKAGMAAAQGTRGASRFARLIESLMPILRRSRGIGRIVAKMEELLSGLRGVRRLASAEEAARRFVTELRAAGKMILVNIGGEGEVAGAINLNIQRRLNVPIENFVEADAARIGELFEANSLDGIVSNRLPPNTLDWERVLPGAHKVMKPGSRIVLKFQGAGQDGEAIMPLLRKLGFREINDWGGSGAVFEAIK